MRRLLPVLVCAVIATRVASAPTPETAPPTPAHPTPAPAPTPPVVEPPAPPPGAPLPEPKPPAEDAGKTQKETEKNSQGDAEKRAEATRRCEAHDPKCDWMQTFSSLERSSIGRVLVKRGYALEPEPWGKVIAHVHVFNEDVFAEDNWLQFFNFIHYTTRDSAIRSELTIGEGEVWDPERVAETSRNLRDPLYSSVIALVPVKSSEPGKVDLLVVTRDVWSLRFNSQYTYQDGSLTNLTISLSENNFLGHRALFAGGIIMDQGSIAVGPIFIDKNLLGKHLDFRVRVDEIFTRRSLAPQIGDPVGLQDGTTLHSEGRDATITLSRPLWSLASKWGWGASYTYSSAIARSFVGTQLFPYDNPDTPEKEQIPSEYRLDTWSVNANAVRQWGTTLKQQVSFGNTVASQRPSLLPNFPDNFGTEGQQAERAAFIRDVLPRSELVSQVFVGYAFYFPRYSTLRNIDTYELAEDVKLGPDLSISVAQALKVLGSDRNFQRPSLSLGWTLPWCHDGFVRPSANASLRIQDGTTIDNTAGLQIKAATPLYRYFRMIGQTSLETRWHDTQNQFFYVGSSSGLRGFRINQFRGDRRFSTVVEARTISVPLPLWPICMIWDLHCFGSSFPSVRIGAVGFYELGGAADTLSAMGLHHDAGVGVRVLIPQTSRDVFRFDLAFPLDTSTSNIGGATVVNPAGRPHLMLGFGSYF